MKTHFIPKTELDAFELEALLKELPHLQEAALSFHKQKYRDAAWDGADETLAGIAMDDLRTAITWYINDRLYSLENEDLQTN